jgi:hypothetical protein
MNTSADMARWHADVAARRAKYSPDLLAAFLADVVTDCAEGSVGPMATHDPARRGSGAATDRQARRVRYAGASVLP